VSVEARGGSPTGGCRSERARLRLRPPAYTQRVARTYRTEAVVLRSFRLGEADRVLHLYTLDRGRVGAVAKGVRKTRSRFGARLEPLSHVELVLHPGRGELHTVTGASLVAAHHRAREHPYRLGVGLIGIEAMLRLFTEQEASERAFTALTRFLDCLDELEPRAARPALDPLGLSFQLKLLWLSGYLPHLDACVQCGQPHDLVGYLPGAGGAVCRSCDPGSLALPPASLQGMRRLLRSPLADAHRADLGGRAARDALAVVTASYEHHGGFRLRTLSA
jgi:DNA repair protein RecO (recombination protein O)